MTTSTLLEATEQFINVYQHIDSYHFSKQAFNPMHGCYLDFRHDFFLCKIFPINLGVTLILAGDGDNRLPMYYFDLIKYTTAAGEVYTFKQGICRYDDFGDPIYDAPFRKTANFAPECTMADFMLSFVGYAIICPDHCVMKTTKSSYPKEREYEELFYFGIQNANSLYQGILTASILCGMARRIYDDVPGHDIINKAIRNIIAPACETSQSDDATLDPNRSLMRYHLSYNSELRFY